MRLYLASCLVTFTLIGHLALCVKQTAFTPLGHGGYGTLLAAPKPQIGDYGNYFYN